MAATFEILKKIFNDQFDQPSVTPQTLLIEVLSDSVAVVIFLSEIEKSFGVVFESSELIKIKDLEELAKLIEKKSSKEKSISYKKDQQVFSKKFIERTMLAFFDVFLTILFKTYFKIEVKGDVYKLQKADNLILIANHTSHLDTFVLYRLLNKKQRNKTYVAAAKDYFLKNRFLEFIFTHIFNFISFDRLSNYNEGLDLATQVLKQGFNLIVYPEGTRSIDGKMGKFKKGIGYILIQENKIVFPVHIENTFRLWPKGSLIPKPGAIRVNILPSYQSKGEAQSSTTEDVTRIVSDLEHLFYEPK